MVSIIKEIKAYTSFTINSIHQALCYKSNVFFEILSNGVILVVTYFLWMAIYKNSSFNIIKGFTKNEMILYIILTFLTPLLTSIRVLGTVLNEVKSGRIATNLVKPINFRIRLIFEALGRVIFNLTTVFLIGFIILLVLAFKFNYHLSFINIILYFISCTFSFLIFFHIYYSFALLSFKITNMWGLSRMVLAIIDLFSGSLIPISFFPNAIKSLLLYLPFSSIIYTPTMIFLGKLTPHEIGVSFLIQICWVIILVIISKIMWHIEIKNITILGG